MKATLISAEDLIIVLTGTRKDIQQRKSDTRDTIRTIALEACVDLLDELIIRVKEFDEVSE